MKPILVFIFHAIVLLLLSTLFYFLIGLMYHESFWRVFILSKSYFYTNIAGSLSLLLFFIPSTLKSTRKIILICLICFVFTSVSGGVVCLHNVWYTNIPEVVILYSQFGFQLTISNAMASFITCSLTGIALYASIAKKVKPS